MVSVSCIENWLINLAIAIRIVNAFPFDLTISLLGVYPIDMLAYGGNEFVQDFSMHSL